MFVRRDLRLGRWPPLNGWSGADYRVLRALTVVLKAAAPRRPVSFAFRYRALLIRVERRRHA